MKFFDDINSTHHDTVVHNQGATGAKRVSESGLHVCIIGAGITGLRCADILTQHNIRVTILEGRDRVGGRVRLK